MKEISVIVPASMKEDTVKILTDKLKLKYGEDSKINMSADDNLIGGFVLECDGEITDCSVNGQMKKIRKYLSGEEQ